MQQFTLVNMVNAFLLSTLIASCLVNQQHKRSSQEVQIEFNFIIKKEKRKKEKNTEF